MKIVINNRLTVGHQILDAWHANSQCQTKNYCPNIEYVFDQIDNVAEYDLSIFCDYMPDQMSLDLIKKYDLILICNGGEPIETANPLIKQLLEYSNVYLIANSLLDQRHILHDKVIWFPNHIQLCRDYWTRYFYPQYYANQKFSKLPKNNLLTAVNGSNRSNRRYFFDLLENKISDLPVKSIFTPDQADQVLRGEMQKMMRKKIQPNIDMCNDFLTQNAKKAGVKQTASGLQYEVITEGAGARPADTSVVKVHYQGFLLNATKPFDSSIERGAPAEFPLNGVIRGWTEGVQLMTVGSKYKFYIPYQLGYGEQGSGETIPGGSLLIFEVELLEIVKTN